MMNDDSLRSQLTKLKERTAGSESIGVASWWVGDKAGERRVIDDLEAGRIAWRAAHRSAKNGLKALEDENLEMAEICLTDAIWLYIEALEKRAARLRPEDLRKMRRSAGKRGRPPGSKNKQPSRKR